MISGNKYQFIKNSGLNSWADWIQNGVRYILEENVWRRCDSYNLFFIPMKTESM